jgi:hypothetical protein
MLGKQGGQGVFAEAEMLECETDKNLIGRGHQNGESGRGSDGSG